jgi:hypothetical protein
MDRPLAIPGLAGDAATTSHRGGCGGPAPGMVAADADGRL